MSVAGDSHLDRRDKARSAQRAGGTQGNVWRGYINVSLNAQQKAEFDDWAHTEDTWLALSEAVSSGCQLGLKYQAGEACFLASLTQRTEGHVNAGLCVTARSVTADKALLRVLYLYRLLGSDGPWEAVQGVADPARW